MVFRYLNFVFLPGWRLLHPHDGAGLDVLTPDLGRVVPDDEEVLGVEGVPLHLRHPGSLAVVEDPEDHVGAPGLGLHPVADDLSLPGANHELKYFFLVLL